MSWNVALKTVTPVSPTLIVCLVTQIVMHYTLREPKATVTGIYAESWQQNTSRLQGKSFSLNFAVMVRGKLCWSQVIKVLTAGTGIMQ